MVGEPSVQAGAAIQQEVGEKKPNPFARHALGTCVMPGVEQGFTLNNRDSGLKILHLHFLFIGQDELPSFNILAGAFLNMYFIFCGEHNALGNLSSTEQFGLAGTMGRDAIY